MSKKIKSIAVNVLLILLVISIFFIGYNVFISGPLRVYETDDINYVNSLRSYDRYKDSSLELLNRFSFDKTYYIVESKANDEHLIVWYSKDHSLLKSVEYKALPSLNQLNDLGMPESSGVSYGVYNDELVYVIKDGVHEVYLDYGTYDVVFEVGVKQ